MNRFQGSAPVEEDINGNPVTKDVNGNPVTKDVNSGGFVSNADFGAKKVKKVADGKPISITHSVSKSYTIPIFLYDKNERLMKMKGKGIKYVD